MTHRNRPSITRRLLLATLAIMPLFLGMTGYAIDRAHTHSLTTAEHNRLRLAFYGLLGVMEWSDEQKVVMERLRNPMFGQFRSGLYAAISPPMEEPYWISRSASTMPLPFDSGKTPAIGQETFDQVTHNGSGYLRFQYQILWEDDSGTEYPLLFTILADRQGLIEEQQSFRHQLALWLIVAAVILLAVQMLVLRWGLNPLRLLTRELHDLEQGKQEQLERSYPGELTGITTNLNRLLIKEHKQRERYRNTLADLAHSLKTPLSVLKSAFGDPQPPAPELVNEQLNRMEGIIAYQLQRAVTAGPKQLGYKTAVNSIIERLLSTLDKVYRDKSVKATNSVPESLTLPMDEQDLMELLGNLLDNAFKACDRQVSVVYKNIDGRDCLLIRDDGPGIDQTRAEQLVQRGQRGDQYGSGQGLGLAIVVDIMQAYQGDIRFSANTPKGTTVTLCLP